MRYLHYSPSPSPCWGIAQSRSWRGCLGVVGVYVVGCDPFYDFRGIPQGIPPGDTAEDIWYTLLYPPGLQNLLKSKILLFGIGL